MAYHNIETRIWNDETFIKLSDQAKLLFIYFLTSPHSNMTGLYIMRMGYIMGDLGWGYETVRQTLSELLENQLIVIDEALSVVFIPNFLIYNPIQNPNQFKGAIYCLKQLPKTELISNIIPYLETTLKGFSKQSQLKLETVLKRLTQGFGNPIQSNCRRNRRRRRNNVEGEKESKKTFPEDSVEIKLSNLLLEEILKRKLDFKKPNLQSWGQDIDKMIHVDNRSIEQIEKVILWVQRDQFWQDNILSTAKLRKQFDQLELKMGKSQEETKKTW